MAATLGAQEIPLGTTAVDESFDQFGRPAVALAGGGFAVVWLVEVPYTAARMQWLDADGEILFEPGGRQIAGGADFALDGVEIVADPAGGAFVAHSERFNGSDSTMLVQRFDETGTSVWANPVVVSLAFEARIDPTVVPDGAGGAYVCFRLLQTGGIWCQHVDRDGAVSWDPNGLPAGGVGTAAILPQTISDGEGGVLVFWGNLGRFDATQPEPFLLHGQRFDRQGQRLWGADGLLIRTSGLLSAGSYVPEVFEAVPDGEGGAVLAFDDSVDPVALNFDVVAQRVTRDGDLLWSDGAVVYAGAANRTHDATIATPDGGAVVITRESTGAEATGTELRLYRLSGDGEHLWSTDGVPLSDPASEHLDYFSHGSFDRGILQVAWTHQTAQFSIDFDIHVSRFRADGQRLGPLGGTVVMPANHARFCQAFVFSEVTGKALIVWDDLRGDFIDGDVYA
ncbi:MAG: hypothetical protein AAGE94_22710, partial [Acidobacteriota bacterium]